MSKETIESLLKNFGVTETETQVYLFLCRHGSLKGTDAAKQIKKDKAQVYHILRSLQAKGLVELTLEAPARFAPVTFEKVVELAIKAKRDEAARIQMTKKELVSNWKNLRKSGPERPTEKFMIIEGRTKIYARISQMILSTKAHFSTISTVEGLLRANQFGLYDVANRRPLKSRIQFRFLTEVTSQNLEALKTILKKLSHRDFGFRGRNPDFGLHLTPPMIIKDEEEAIFFIQPVDDGSSEEDVCLWTNSKSLVKTFNAVFENLWENSSDIEKKLVEIETGKPSTQTYLIGDAEKARKKYQETLELAKREIVIVTSSDGLEELDSAKLKKWKEANVLTKIMAPITSENLAKAQELSKYGEIRHVTKGYLGTTVVDGKYTFQFKVPQANKKLANYFENTFYSDELEYVEKNKAMLDGIWENAQTPSIITLNSIPSATIVSCSEHVVYNATKKMIGHVVMEDEEASRNLTEKSVIEKIIDAQKKSVGAESSDVIKIYSTNGQSIIHPPSHLKLPDILFHTYHIEKQSTFGAEDAIMVHLWLSTPAGLGFVPTAVVTDNPLSIEFWKKACGATPAGTNVQLVKKDELKACIHGNTLFVGWTIQIPLLDRYSIPPSSLLIEGYGNVKTNAYKATVPSGYTLKTEGNILEAFVTFLNPLSKYSGPGTDGAFGRDIILEFYPPQEEH